MKLALVYDRVVKFGGAERILLALNELWPEAPLFTALYDKNTAGWADRFKIIPSFLNSFPGINKIAELATPLMPYAFENFDFSDFDVVISISSHDAKSIITKPGTLHINYCLTPTRYLWSGFEDYYREPAFGLLNPVVRMGMKSYLEKIRKWDLESANRPDLYISISNTVKNRIKKIYHRGSDIIYPPLDTGIFIPSVSETKDDFFLIVSRLVPYKRIDYAIGAFNKLKERLIIIGSGIDKKRLMNLAGSNIEFIDGNLTDQKLCWYYQNCACLIFPGIEDFGLTPLEAQACGKAVIAINKGGATESVIGNKTGILYDTISEESLIAAVRGFDPKDYDPVICRKNALRFSKKEFLKVFKDKIEKYYLNIVN